MTVHPDEETISAWLDGEAAPAEAAFMRCHMADCSRCQAQLEALAEVRMSLSALRNVTAPPQLTHRLMVDWESRWGRLNSRRPVGSFVLAWVPAVAVTMAVALVVPQLHTRRNGTPDVMPEPRPDGPVATHLPSSNPSPTEESLAPSIARMDRPVAPAPVSTGKKVGTKARKGAKTPSAARQAPHAKPAGPRREGARPDRREERDEKILRRRRPEPPTAGRVMLAAHESAAAPHTTRDVEETPVEVARTVALAPVLELIVEETPDEIRPPEPYQTSVAWVATHEKTGRVSAGSMTRSFSPDGTLQSVALHLPAPEQVASAASGTNEHGNKITPPSDLPSDPNDTDKNEDTDGTQSPNHSSVVAPGLYAGVLRDVAGGATGV